MKNRASFAKACAGLFLSVAAVSTAAAQAPEPSPMQLPARWSYAARFACGQPAPAGHGSYATVIHIHNPGSRGVQILKEVALASSETGGAATFAPPAPRFKDQVPPSQTLSVDCAGIAALVMVGTTGVQPGQPLEGFLVIDVVGPCSQSGPAPELYVEVVTTEAASGTAVSSTRVNPVAGRHLPAGVWAF
jgi:hypothetical protein